MVLVLRVGLVIGGARLVVPALAPSDSKPGRRTAGRKGRLTAGRPAAVIFRGRRRRGSVG